jgi:hypothetical protein
MDRSKPSPLAETDESGGVSIVILPNAGDAGFGRSPHPPIIAAVSPIAKARGAVGRFASRPVT